MPARQTEGPLSPEAASMRRLRAKRAAEGVEDRTLLLSKADRRLVERVAKAMDKPFQEVAGMLAAAAARDFLARLSQLELSLTEQTAA